MKPPPFEYVRPETLEHALELLASTENCKLLAGGQSLMGMLNMRYILPDALIDINRISELSGLDIRDSRLEIGAMVRQRTLERSDVVREHLPIMADALKHVGHRQTRNRGTIGGSICHLDPSGELPTIALLYDAEVHIASASGRRQLAMRDFIAGYMSVDLAPDEMLTRITFQLWRKSHSYAFLEHARRRGDFAIASAACLVERDSGIVSRIALAVGGLSETPVRLHAAEAILAKTDMAPDLIEQASATVKELPALSDVHADADYRRHVASVLTSRALRQTLHMERPPAEAGV